VKKKKPDQISKGNIVTPVHFGSGDNKIIEISPNTTNINIKNSFNIDKGQSEQLKVKSWNSQKVTMFIVAAIVALAAVIEVGINLGWIKTNIPKATYTYIINLFHNDRTNEVIIKELEKIAKLQEVNDEAAPSGESGLDRYPKYDDNSIGTAEQMLAAKEQGKAISDKNIRWSKAVIAHNKGNWAEALPLWQRILSDDSDNLNALFCAALATYRLANTKPEGPERTKLFNDVLPYYKKLFGKGFQVASGLYSAASVDLISTLTEAGMLDLARNILDASLDSDGSEAMKGHLALAALHLMKAYIKDQKLSEAQNVFNTMIKLSNTAEIKEWFARAANDLIYEYLKNFDKIAEARNVFDNMLKLGDTEIIKEQCAMAAMNFITVYCYNNVKKFSEARNIFGIMHGLGSSPAVKVWLDRADYHIRVTCQIP